LFAHFNRNCVREQLAFAPFAVALSSAQTAQSAGDAVPEANPARPTVATPATLTPVGYLQFENGAFYAADTGEFSTQFSLNQVTKLTVAPRLELLAQTQPFARSRADSRTENNLGDVFAGLQVVLVPGSDTRPTIAVSYIRRLYEGSAPNIDIGSSRQNFTLLLSDDLHGFHFDINAIATEQTAGRVGRGQFGQTLSISHPFKKLTISGEIWHFSQPFLSGNAVGNLWAASYPVHKNLVFDAGFNRGLTSTSTRWEGFAGFTYLLPHRLWKP
jgi:hypothetical protein